MNEITPKKYACGTCGTEKTINTNHESACFNYCENCSWKGIGYDKTNKSAYLFNVVHRTFRIKTAEVVNYNVYHY